MRMVYVVDNCIRDHFKISDNRERLAPTVPMISEEGRAAAAPPTKPWEALPAKAVSPKGASPNPKAKNRKQKDWDAAQKWNH